MKRIRYTFFLVILLGLCWGEGRVAKALEHGSSSIKDILKSPHKEYYVERLSRKIKLIPLSVKEGPVKHTLVYRYRLKSSLKKIALKNIRVSGRLLNQEGELAGKIKDIRVCASLLPPKQWCIIEVTLHYPRNWGWKRKKCRGHLYLQVEGMLCEGNVCVPMPPIKREEAVYISIPPEKLLYLLWSFLLLTVIGFPFAFWYQTRFPISVTLKLGNVIKGFDLYHKGRISIGGDEADFKIPNCQGIVAEIQRRFRRFVLEEKTKGVIPNYYSPKKGKILLFLGRSFTLNVDGKELKFEFLPGSLPNTGTSESYKEEITEEDLEDLDI